MPKFIKKPVIVDAVQFEWEDGHGIPSIPGVKFWTWTQVETSGGLKSVPDPKSAYVETLEGILHVSRGDWIITGVQGERYPCKPEIFAATYEPVT